MERCQSEGAAGAVGVWCLAKGNLSGAWRRVGTSPATCPHSVWSGLEPVTFGFPSQVPADCPEEAVMLLNMDDGAFNFSNTDQMYFAAPPAWWENWIYRLAVGQTEWIKKLKCVFVEACLWTHQSSLSCHFSVSLNLHIPVWTQRLSGII